MTKCLRKGTAMFSERSVESDLRRNTGRKARARSKASRLALIVAGALAFTNSGHLAFGAENRNGQASGASSASALSMTDQEVAATMTRLGLELSSKPSRDLVKDWQKPKKAIVFAEGAPQRIPWLKTVAPDMKCVALDGLGVHGMQRGGDRRRGGFTKEQLADIADADVQVGVSCSKAVLEAAKKLRIII